jgi:hypothetical protein
MLRCCRSFLAGRCFGAVQLRVAARIRLTCGLSFGFATWEKDGRPRLEEPEARAGRGSINLRACTG